MPWHGTLMMTKPSVGGSGVERTDRLGAGREGMKGGRKGGCAGRWEGMAVSALLLT